MQCLPSRAQRACVRDRWPCIVEQEMMDSTPDAEGLFATGEGTSSSP